MRDLTWDELHLLTIGELEELMKKIAVYEDLIDQVIYEKKGLED